MQYVLSQEEMNEHSRRTLALKNLPSVQELQKFCSFVADNMVVTDGWAKGRVWGCILTSKLEHYCDACPAKDICPHPDKEWSK